MILFSACYYDVKEELEPFNYVNDIAPIIEKSCFSCHNSKRSEGNITYESFEEVIFSIEEGTFIQCIEYQNGFAPMPPIKQLSNENIQVIKKWILLKKPYN